jgi:amino acid permease
LNREVHSRYLSYQLHLAKMATTSDLESPSCPEEISGDQKSVAKTTDKPVDVQDGNIFQDGLQRGLLGRHVTLISLASVIGASCFYGFGYALYLSGPLGALIGFGIVGRCVRNHLAVCSSSYVDRVHCLGIDAERW